MTAIMIVLLALLNDGAILSIAYDNVRYKDQPEAWNMRLVLGIASVLGLVGPVAALGLFYLGDKVFTLGRPEVQTLMYLMLSVAGSLTIFLTRTRGPFWSIRPARVLLIAVFSAQTIATVIAVGGIFVTAPPGYWALIVWGYALAWFLVTDRIKLLAYRLLDPIDPGIPVHAPNDGTDSAQIGHVSRAGKRSARGHTVSAGSPQSAAPADESAGTGASVAEPPPAPTPWPHSRAEAEMREIVHTLRGNHVLTLTEIKKLCWAAHWPEHDFTTALTHAIAAGDIKQLSDDLYEIPESRRHNA